MIDIYLNSAVCSYEHEDDNFYLTFFDKDSGTRIHVGFDQKAAIELSRAIISQLPLKAKDALIRKITGIPESFEQDLDEIENHIDVKKYLGPQG